jgi:hypothetical protein
MMEQQQTSVKMPSQRLKRRLEEGKLDAVDGFVSCEHLDRGGADSEALRMGGELSHTPRNATSIQPSLCCPPGHDRSINTKNSYLGGIHFKKIPTKKYS